MLAPVLERHRRAVLLAVGPEHTAEWERASQRVHGRIRAFGEREDTAIFYQAADIYVDSYPVVSITSLLEAGSYGLPLVTRSPLAGDPSILGADAPGLTDHLIQTRNIDEYHSALSRLIENEGLRNDLGLATSERVTALHSGTAWRDALEGIYAYAAELPPVMMDEVVDNIQIEELDIMWSYFFRNDLSVDDILQYHMKNLPLDIRLKESMRLLVSTRKVRPNLLLPEWATANLKGGYRAVASLRGS
jgi:hypothetical protein